MTRLEPASFEVERFGLAGNACLEVRGRWFGVRGRRFMRPALTTVADGREQRILAVLDHKPWNAEEGETWLAAFPCSTDPAMLAQAELTVAPDVTVPLPPPSPPATGRRPRRGASRRIEHDAATRSRDEAVSELQAVKRECERLRGERREARAARDEAARERDAASAERDDAQRARNRMLAERDTARTRVEEVTRQWELTAELGTRRTLERDALTVERDRLARDRDAAVAEGHRIAHERDAALEERDRIARERDAAVEACDHAAEDRDAAVEERDRAAEERGDPVEKSELEADEPTLVLSERELVEWEAPPVVAVRAPIMPRVGQAGRRHAAIETGSVVPEAPGASPGSAHDAADIWRTRLLAVSALLVIVVILVVLLLAE